LAVRVLNPQSGQRILDLCAAPGGKTTWIAQLMQDKGTIIAQELSPARLELVRENCLRLGVTCVEPKLVPPSREEPTFSFDAVLVDAPCSNTGVMRRRADLRWRIRLEELTRLRHSQLDLLASAVLQLKKGGEVIYSTCSLEPEENEGVIKEFLASHPSFQLEEERTVLPFVDAVDGAFVAKLRQKD
jgi:16S rRNA (cytosine967-C5)-methyltransferase